MLASVYCRSENVGIHAVIISELELRDVERHIFGADLMEAADDPALEDAPKTFNRIGVHRADNILLAVVIDRLMIVFGQPMVNLAFIGGEQANFGGDHFAHESLGRFASDVFQNPSNNVAFAGDGTDDWRFGRRAMLTAALFAIPVFIFVFAADEAFVNFDNPPELTDILDQSGTNFVAHKPRGFVGTKPHVAHDLQCAHPLFAGQHQVSDLEPIAERLVSVFEDRSSDMGKTIAVSGALFALPMPLARFQVIDLRIATPGAMHTVGPAPGNQIGFTGIFVREGRVELSGGHLRDGLRSFSHGFSPSMEGYRHE